MDDLMSTREVAALAGVGPTAVKRWADDGLIRCVRTAGGHRRFARPEVEHFLRGRSGQGGRGEREPLLDGMLMDLDPLALEATLLNERAKTGAWYRVAELAGEALGTLGRMWRSGEVSIVEEHLASERLARALARVTAAIPLDPLAPRALLACAEGDDHTLGLALVELVLREAGWAALFAGRRTPFAELGAAISRGRVRMLAVSASDASRDEAELRRQAGALGALCRPPGVALVLGGAGAWPERPRYGTRLQALEALYHRALAMRAEGTGPGAT